MALPPDQSPGPHPPSPSRGPAVSGGFFSMKYLLAAALFAFTAPLALAQELAPDALIQRISEEVLGAIKDDKELRAGDSARIAALVEAKVLPHFDFRRATQTAMGANWRRASAEQQEELTREFRTLLVRTYSGALTAYRDHPAPVSPPPSTPGRAEVPLPTLTTHAGAQP